MNIYPSSKDVNVTPSSEGQDLVGKMRVSNPQSLIDTDFEYGIQPTKWETVNTLNNKPTAFYDPSRPLSITDVSSTGTRVVTVSTTTPPAVGVPIYVQDTTNSFANGWYLVDSVSAGVSFTYTASSNVPSGSIYDSTKTYIYSANFFTGAGISTTSITNTSTNCTVTTTQAHGFAAGNFIYIVGTTATTNPPNGAWVITSTPTANTFVFGVPNAPTGTINISGATTTLYSRPSGYIIHRAFDGGVHMTAGGGNPNAALARQTRRYFRYQSGKAIQYSTGTALKPNLFVDVITSSGTTATVNCRFIHNLQTGNLVQVVGSTDTAYNGIFQITVVSSTTFTYTMLATPAATTAVGFPIFVSVYSWYGNTNRVGFFDSQNGAYIEFDGQTLSVVRRKSVDQLSGNLSVTSGSNVVSSLNSRFVDQLVIGDYIVLRGNSYRITSINSQTNMLISPEYRGTTANNVVGSKTVELRIPQSQWNLDKCDGTGPSGYNIDLTRTQMMYIDYSWYGSGPIRWGFRTTNGKIAYCHQERNNNINFEAFFRSGNLPARYENTTVQPITYLTATLANTELTTANVNSTAGFPSSGLLKINKGNQSGAIEVIAYTGITANTFTGLTRTQSGGNGTAQTFTYSATAPQSVELVSQNSAAALSHWGSSVIMDGRFDNDLNFQFNAGMSTALSIAAGATNALLSIRLAPSVSNAVTGDLGIRDLVNRAQMKLQGLEITAGGSSNLNSALIVEGVINPGNYPNTVTNITWYNLQGTVQAGNLLGSGQPSFAQVAPAGSIKYDNTLTYTVTAAGSTQNTGSYVILVNSTATIQVGDVLSATQGTNSILAGNSVVTAFSGTNWVVLGNSLVGQLTNGTTITGYRNTWAQPGETIFSFISSPANKDSIDLTGLKELTNTPLGGRGTYPNGPDTLFINVYLTQGSPINAQLVLRWAEPQA